MRREEKDKDTFQENKENELKERRNEKLKKKKIRHQVTVRKEK